MYIEVQSEMINHLFVFSEDWCNQSNKTKECNHTMKQTRLLIAHLHQWCFLIINKLLMNRQLATSVFYNGLCK